MTDKTDDDVGEHTDDVDRGDEDEEPVVDASGGKEADGVGDDDEENEAEANVEDDS